MGFEQMQPFSSEQNLCESFSRDLLYQGSSEVPAQNNWGGEGRREFQECLGKNLSLCLSLCFTWCMSSQGSSEHSGADWKLLKIQSLNVHCVLHVCFFFLTSGSWLDIKQGIIGVEEGILVQVLQGDTPVLLVTEVLISLLEEMRLLYCSYLFASWSIDTAQINLLACILGLTARPMFLLKSVYVRCQNPSPPWHMEVCWDSNCKFWAWQEGCSSASLVGMAGGMPHWTGTAQGLLTVGGCRTFISLL